MMSSNVLNKPPVFIGLPNCNVRRIQQIQPFVDLSDEMDNVEHSSAAGGKTLYASYVFYNPITRQMEECEITERNVEMIKRTCVCIGVIDYDRPSTGTEPGTSFADHLSRMKQKHRENQQRASSSSSSSPSPPSSSLVVESTHTLAPGSKIPLCRQCEKKPAKMLCAYCFNPSKYGRPSVKPQQVPFCSHSCITADEASPNGHACIKPKS